MVETHITAAQERVEREQEHVAGERRAYKRFRSEVAAISPTPPGTASGRAGGVVSTLGAGDAGSGDCRRLREAFAETVRPYSVEDVADKEPLLETLREELGDSIALALAPSTDHGVTPQVKGAIAAETGERLQELDAMAAAVKREESSLADAAADVEAVTEWLIEADETALSTLGFDELRARYERLESEEERCRERLRERQRLLHSTCGGDAHVTLRQRAVAEFLYRSFPVRYPVLSTVTRLLESLSECKRAVRAHLLRRA